MLKTPAPRMIVLEDLRGRGVRLRDGDTVSVDANPLVRHRIVSAVAVASGRASPEVRAQEEEAVVEAVPAPTIEDAAAQGRLILLAEDNPTNQDVIRRQLLRLGYACEIVNNGARALEAHRTGRYAIILTDCHMPEMDGYDLAREIRREEKSGARIPIVAITANALQGEAARCLAAGMDDYLSKPVTMRALRDAIRKWMPSTSVVDVSPGPARPDSPPSGGPVSAAPAMAAPAVDERVLKDMFGEDHAQFLEILESFVAPSQKIVSDMAAGLRERDAERIKDAAHQLKSSSRTIGAGALADVCLDLEKAARAQEWESIDLLGRRAEEEMRSVQIYIETAIGR